MGDIKFLRRSELPDACVIRALLGSIGSGQRRIPRQKLFQTFLNVHAFRGGNAAAFRGDLGAAGLLGNKGALLYRE